MTDRSSVKVAFLGDADHLARASRKAMGDLDAVGRKASGIGSKIANVGKNAALGIAGGAALAIGGLTAAMANGVRDAMSYQKVTAITNAAIKSTGGVANVSAKSVKALSGELESLSGVDEELIVNAQNVLLTFTKVRNEAGKGNDVFTQGTKAALNMSIALKQDLKASATLVGKALNDPIKGMTAMNKAGVQFTDQQKKQIRTMVESGNVLGAQKVILRELETQFGGVAKAAGSGLEGSLARAKDAFSDLFRNIATPLLPKIAEWAEGFAEKVNDDIAPAIMRFIDQFERGVGPGGEFRDTLGRLSETARDAVPHIKGVFEKTKAAVDFVIKHKDAFGAITGGIVAYRTAMKSAAIWSATMGTNGPLAAAGMTAAGNAAKVNTGKVAALATVLSRAAGAAGLLAGAYMMDEKDGPIRGTLNEIGGGAKKVVGGDIGGGLQDILLGDSAPTWLGGKDNKAPAKPKPVKRTPTGSSQDRVGSTNPTTKTFPRKGQVAGLREGSGETRIVLELDGKTLTEVVLSHQQKMRRGGRDVP